MKPGRKVLSIILVALMIGTIGAMSVSFTGCSKKSSVIKIAMLPKFKGENYFDAVKTGAQSAIDELNKDGKKVEFLYDGPPQDQATNQEQVNILEGWMAQKVSVILVSCDDQTAIAPTLKKAMSQGIKVVTFDADAEAGARDLFVNQATAAGIAQGLLTGAAAQLKTKGYGPSNPVNLAVVSSAKTDANQQAWLGAIKTLLATSDYSWIKIKNEQTDVYYPGPDETTTQNMSGTVISRMGVGADKIQLAIGLTSMAGPALASQYQAASVKPDVSKVVMEGVATPDGLKSYIKDDTNPMKVGVLWNCMDLGYLSVQTGYQLFQKTITDSSTSITAGKLGQKDIVEKQIVLGPTLIFDKTNVDSFNY